MEDKCILLRVYNQGGGGGLLHLFPWERHSRIGLEINSQPLMSSEQGFTWHQIIDKENNDLLRE